MVGKETGIRYGHTLCRYRKPLWQSCTGWRFQNEVGWWRRFLWGKYVDPTPVSWHTVAKTGAILGPMRSFLWSDTPLRYYTLTLDWFSGHFYFDFGGVCSRWTAAARCAFPSVRIAIGISTLALPSCAVSPTISSLYYEFLFVSYLWSILW